MIGSAVTSSPLRLQRQLQTTYQGLQRVSDGQLCRLLDEDAKSSLNKTQALLREVMPPLVKAVTLRSTQETEQIKNQQVEGLFGDAIELRQAALGKAPKRLDAIHAACPSCHIPDDWIDNNRTPLFIARRMVHVLLERYAPHPGNHHEHCPA